jgi:hypothetical protein
MTAAASAPAPRAAQPATAADTPARLDDAFRVFAAHASPRILSVALAAALTARVAVGDWSAWDVVPAAATIAYWPIQEWLIHVFVLHRRPTTWSGRTIDFRVPRKHRAHHRDPWRLDLLFIPLHSYVYTLPLLVGLWFAATPSTPLALTGIVAHLAGAVHYEWVHFLAHTRVVPPLRYLKRLVRNHRLHHFKNEHYWFGVTRLGGDRLLGTAPRPADVPTSPTARSLAGARPALL